MKTIKFLLLLVFLACLGPLARAQSFSPNGTISLPPSGAALVTSFGTFTYGAPTTSGNYQLLQDGVVTGAEINKMEVATNGQLVRPGRPALGSGIVKANVHNAPGWLPNHSYNQGQRVNNGPGWNGSAFVPYEMLRAYQVTSGTCTSAGSGGPTGTGTSISDNTCTWKYLSDTDYVTITGYGHDAPPWVAGPYGWRAVVAAGTPLTAYEQTNPSCTSTINPSVGSSADGCVWAVLAQIIYTSGRDHIPQETYVYNNYGNVNITHPYEGDLWNDREYVIGQNGEMVTDNTHALFERHSQYFTHSVGAINPHWPGMDANGAWTIGPTGYDGVQAPIIVTAAPGESFADTLRNNPSLPLSGYDQSKGVAISGMFEFHDSDAYLTRLQIRNLAGPAISNSGDTNLYSAYVGNIIEANGDARGNAPITGATMNTYANNLIISHGSVAIFEHYTGNVLNNTIVNPEGTGLVAMELGSNYLWRGTTISNNVFVGFQHLMGSLYGAYAAYNDPVNCANGCLSTFQAHNYTDSAIDNAMVPGTSPAGTVTTVWGWDASATLSLWPLPGTVYNVSKSSLFVGPNDYRVPNTSPLHNAGAAWGNVDLCPIQNSASDWGFGPCPYNWDTPDILGNTRPSSGSDVGAWQTPRPPRPPLP